MQENRRNKSPQKRGPRKHIRILNNRRRSIAPAASAGITKQKLATWSTCNWAEP